MNRARALACLLAGLTVVACGSGNQRYLVNGPGGSASGTPGPTSAPTKLNDFLPVAEKFIEEHRGLKFTKHVPVTLLSDADFTKKLNEKNTTNEADLQKAAKELEAMGLIQGHPDLGPIEKALLSGSVVGFYDTQAKELFVRGDSLTPYTQEVMVHELTHAVQDQHFDIYRPALSNTNDEQSIAFLSLTEGDAVTLQNAYRASLSAADQAKAAAEESAGSGGIPANTPRVLLELLAFPYIAGPKFVAAVRAAKGQAGLDEAFAHPPTTTQQILHPETFFSKDTGKAVAKPIADGPAFDDGVLGEQGFDLLLEKALTDGNLDTTTAQTADKAWDGDHYVAWDASSTSSCIRITFAARTTSDNAALKLAMESYVQTLPQATVESTSPLTFKSCG